jgi:fucose permease
MLSATFGIVLSIVALLIQGPTSVWFIAFLGLGNALLWPAIWPLSLEGLGGSTSKGSALLIMGVIGGGIVPLLYGTISDVANPHLAYSVLLPLYVFILYFATRGYKLGR